MNINLHSRKKVPTVTVTDRFFGGHDTPAEDFINTTIAIDTSDGLVEIEIFSVDTVEVTDKREQYTEVA